METHKKAPVMTPNVNKPVNNTRRALMSRPIIAALIALTLLPSSGPGFIAALQAQGDQPPAVPAEEQPEALTGGPIHEAFAQPVPTDQQQSTIAPTQPPANIQEDPPAARPAGENVFWVPGYWSWDTDRKGYIWVSACWRATVPDMQWVPGYWHQVPTGWEWVPGFWTKSATKEIEYLAPPPVIQQADPIVVTSSADTIWVPPCYYWVGGQYVLRNGYWLAAQPGWVWVPSYYCRTPRGHVFVPGHWDYELEHRGVLFAPVYIPPTVYVRHSYRYSPSIVVNLRGLTVSLFACPRYSHFYFGDYYDDVYISVGIYPWFDCDRRRSWYDPIYQHHRWYNQRNNPRWEVDCRRDYDNRRADPHLRPARTYREMEARVARAPEPQRRDLQTASPYNRYIADNNNRARFQDVTPDERRQLSDRNNQFDKFRQDRSRWESDRRSPAGPSGPDNNNNNNNNNNPRDNNRGPDRVKTQGSPVSSPPSRPNPGNTPSPNDRRDSRPNPSAPNRDTDRDRNTNPNDGRTKDRPNDRDANRNSPGGSNPPGDNPSPRPAPGNPSDRDSNNRGSAGSNDRGQNDRNSAGSGSNSNPDRTPPRKSERDATPAPAPAPAPQRPSNPNPPSSSPNPGSGKTPATPPPPPSKPSPNPDRPGNSGDRGSNDRGSSDRGQNDRGSGNSAGRDRASSNPQQNPDRNPPRKSDPPAPAPQPQPAPAPAPQPPPAPAPAPQPSPAPGPQRPANPSPSKPPANPDRPNNSGDRSPSDRPNANDRNSNDRGQNDRGSSSRNSNDRR